MAGKTTSAALKGADTYSSSGRGHSPGGGLSLSRNQSGHSFSYFLMSFRAVLSRI